MQAVRFGTWKAVKPDPKAAIELYDLAKDPGETRDLAAQHPERVAQAIAFMKAKHQPSPDWPLTGKAAQRLLDERDSFKNTPR